MKKFKTKIINLQTKAIFAVNNTRGEGAIGSVVWITIIVLALIGITGVVTGAFDDLANSFDTWLGNKSTAIFK